MEKHLRRLLVILYLAKIFLHQDQLRLSRVQTNLEKPGKPGKIYIFEKNKGISGKKWIFGRKSGKTQGNFFLETFPLKPFKFN